ncbi:apolipoprotein N-acyltransferase [Megalodesulfovibrio gigas]|uniref:Apolipoprotein N-acyltransferase n=1 Tax=Megalodesulfovibrio gigas (strain ATCC 19364 / DSM 1382 / NCIMB 9332 / VKM B-1759) TaxID=1121448 RepID=T2GD26_MEGG1|nr:apolipoprotein N-acyltransferase [Megalodesulfovibrio gigas]AGW14485.1 putative apolipoprotein N-acyltransferase [Megalodesulfovibrio gigas DSM 1382 = ATCC 19364]
MIYHTLLVILGSFFGFANPFWQLPALALLVPGGLYLLGLSAQSPGQAMRRGWVAGGLGASASLYWVAVPVHDFAYIPWALAAPCAVLLGMTLGFFSGVFSMACRHVARRLPLLPAALFAGTVWGLLEAAKGYALTGFPWLVLPAAFAPWPLLIQGLSTVGSWGLAGVLAMAAASWAHGRWIKHALGASALPGALLGLLLMAGLFLHGVAVLQEPQTSDGTAIVAVVQGNVDQSVKWNEAYQQETIDRYVSLSRSLATQHASAPPKVILWPETSMPFYFQEPGEPSQQVRSLAADLGVPVLLGAPGYDRDPQSSQYRFYNRAYLLGKDGAIQSYYEKEHLVPFGEYIPFGKHFSFLKKLVEGPGDFAPGQLVAPLQLGHLSMGVLICYETIFPELAQKRVAEGANVLVNLSNDAWFGKTAAPTQHLHLAVLRAVEQRRSVVRATNTGISAVIMPTGVVRSPTRLFETAVFAMETDLMTSHTRYHVWHYVILPGMAVLSIVCYLWSRIAPSRVPSKTPRYS